MLKRIGDFGMIEYYDDGTERQKVDPNCRGDCKWCKNFGKLISWKPKHNGQCLYKLLIQSRQLYKFQKENK